MSREPDWWQLGYLTAKGTRKSGMALPEDFFEVEQQKITNDNFNVLNFAYDYATAWLETEQWKKEVGVKIRKHIKKIRSENERINTFTGKAFVWAGGYSYFITEQLILSYIRICTEEKCKITEQGLNSLAEQAKFYVCNECKKPIDLKEDTYFIYNSDTKLDIETMGKATRYYHIQCTKKQVKQASKQIKSSADRKKWVEEILSNGIKMYTPHRKKDRTIKSSKKGD